jgi:hypothetical protein
MSGESGKGTGATPQQSTVGFDGRGFDGRVFDGRGFDGRGCKLDSGAGVVAGTHQSIGDGLVDSNWKNSEGGLTW